MLCACAGVVIQPDWGTLFDWAFSSWMPVCADCSSNPVWLSNPTSLSIFLLCACACWLCIQSVKSHLTEHFLVVCLCMLIVHPVCQILPHWAFSCCVPVHADCASSLSNPTSLSIFLLCACACWLCIQSVKSYLTEHFLVVCLCMLIVHPVCQILPHWAFSCCVPVHADCASSLTIKSHLTEHFLVVCLCMQIVHPVWLSNPTSLSIFLLCACACWLE